MAGRTWNRDRGRARVLVSGVGWFAATFAGGGSYALAPDVLGPVLAIQVLARPPRRRDRSWPSPQS